VEHLAFVDRVISHLPSGTPSGFEFASWKHAGRPTEEGFGLMPVSGVTPEQVIDAVMDVDHYVGNVEHVTVCRSVPDDRFSPPEAVRFYQKVKIPVLGAVHHELVLHRVGQRGDFLVAAWHLLKPETDALSGKEAFRSDYNHGAWFAGKGLVGYALGSAPKRDDVGFLKFKALTKGADVAAKQVVKANIEGMCAWAKRR
jgi:hypothetical protein